MGRVKQITAFVERDTVGQCEAIRVSPARQQISAARAAHAIRIGNPPNRISRPG